MLFVVEGDVDCTRSCAVGRVGGDARPPLNLLVQALTSVPTRTLLTTSSFAAT